MTSERIRQVIRDEETKKIIKEAIQEWLNDQLARVGKWTLYGLLSMTVAAMAYLILWMNGWHR